MSQRRIPLAVLAAVAAAAVLLTYGIVVAQVPHRTDNLPVITPRAAPIQSLHRLLHALRDRMLTVPGLTYGSATPSRIRITNDVDYSIGGIIYRKTATDNIASSMSGTALTSAQACLFRVEINSSGTVSVTQGPIVTVASADPPVPARSASKTTLGWIKVTGIAFTPGTTSLNNGSITFNDGDPDLGTSLLAAP